MLVRTFKKASKAAGQRTPLMSTSHSARVCASASWRACWFMALTGDAAPVPPSCSARKSAPSRTSRI
jgi:hypothetical protein